MTETVTLEIPEMLSQQAKKVAEATHRQLTDVLIDWLERSMAEFPVELLSDEEILASCDMQMDIKQQQTLSDLLARHREGQLNDIAVRKLDALMNVYRRGLVRKAQAWKVAVERGLKTPLN